MFLFLLTLLTLLYSFFSNDSGRVLGVDNPTVCHADIDQSGLVDIQDYSILIANFFDETPANPRADIDQSGLVDIQDYGQLVRFFFMSCVQSYIHETNRNFVLLEAEHYDAGRYQDSTVGNSVDGSTNVFRSDDVDIKRLNAAEFAVGQMQTGEWLEYTATFPRSANYSIVTRASTPANDGKLRVEIDGVALSTVSVQQTSNYGSFVYQVTTGGQISAGTHTIRLFVENQWFDLDWIRFDALVQNKTTLMIPAEEYDVGNNSVGYFDKSTGNSADGSTNIYRTDDVDIKRIENNTGFAVGHMETGEWLNFHIFVPETGEYRAILRHASPQTTPNVTLNLDGVNIGTITAENTGGYAVFQDKAVLVGNVSSGKHILRISVGQQFLDIDSLKMEKVITPVITSTPTSTPVPTGNNPTPSLTIAPVPGSAVIIQPSGNDSVTNYVNTILNQHSGPKTFYFKTGMHRISQALAIQEGDILLGEYGAIVSGATKLNPSTVKREGSLYYFDGQTQTPNPRPTANDRGCGLDLGTSGTGCSCKVEYPRCNFNDEFFMNDQQMKHVRDKTSLTAGTFYFDYNSDRLYFFDNPSGKKLEVTVGRKMISYSSAKNVTIRNLIIEKFASPTQESAVENYGDNSIVEFSEIRWNHSTGVGVGNNGKLRNNYVHHNGQFGLGSKGNSTGMLIEKNEVAFNNTSGHEESWGAGGSKWALSENYTVRENYSHHNFGPGFWTDIDNRFVTYNNNVVIDNTKIGIQYELSFEAEIFDNFVANNGNGSNHAQIFIQNSSGRSWQSPIKVYRNTVVTRTDSGNGITVQNNNRGDSNIYERGSCTFRGDPDCWDWIAKFVDIYDNKIYHRATHVEGFASGLYAFNRSQYPDPYNFESVADFIKFRNNQYYYPNATAKKWSWGPYWTTKTYAEFQSIHPGETKPLITNFTVPTTPVWNFPRGPQQVNTN